ncbi:hypothetical protein [Halobacillus sp. K22]|uniref:hypothetical protein n=1 Tax=Halobacillus sp. K22 TaxID=3457431 RepID=UPI003FCEB536
MYTFNYMSLEEDDRNYYLFDLQKLPEYCPRCNNKSQEPTMLEAYKYRKKTIEAIFKCNSKYCGEIFLSRLTISTPPDSPLVECYVVESYPKNPVTKKFNEYIEQLSSKFVEIYNQAKEAEGRELEHIAGMGYRKSLEFLIKDYLIEFKDLDRNTVIKTPLGTCINNYLSNNVKEIAKRAAWLGNDETHYHRVWETKDIKDLKVLIDITVHNISSEIQTQKYINEMRN